MAKGNGKGGEPVAWTIIAWTLTGCAGAGLLCTCCHDVIKGCKSCGDDCGQAVEVARARRQSQVAAVRDGAGASARVRRAAAEARRPLIDSVQPVAAATAAAGAQDVQPQRGYVPPPPSVYPPSYAAVRAAPPVYPGAAGGVK